MEIVGKIKVIGPTINVSDSFKKRELVVTTDSQYSETILIEFTQDKCDLLNHLSIGQNLKVSINLSGREWVNLQGETKYFNSIKGWRIEKVEAAPVATSTNAKNTSFEPITNYKEEEHDDLPF